VVFSKLAGHIAEALLGILFTLGLPDALCDFSHA